MSKYRGALRWAMDRQCNSATEKMILVAMARAGNESRECYMAYHKIAEAACCTERTVIRTIPKLIKRGLIERVTTGRSRRATITYRLCVDGPPARQLVAKAVTAWRPLY
jgi:DNA-binding MarR family transcriptional regulator